MIQDSFPIQSDQTIGFQNRGLEGHFEVGFDFLKLHPRGVVVNTQMDREQKKLLQNETETPCEHPQLNRRRKGSGVVWCFPCQLPNKACSWDALGIVDLFSPGMGGGGWGFGWWHLMTYTQKLKIPSTDEYPSMQLITSKIASNFHVCFQCSLPRLLQHLSRTSFPLGALSPFSVATKEHHRPHSL